MCLSSQRSISFLTLDILKPEFLQEFWIVWVDSACVENRRDLVELLPGTKAAVLTEAGFWSHKVHAPAVMLLEEVVLGEYGSLYIRNEYLALTPVGISIGRQLGCFWAPCSQHFGVFFVLSNILHWVFLVVSCVHCPCMHLNFWE